MGSLKCPTCGKMSPAVYRCSNCGDVRCNVCNTVSKAPAGYERAMCKACKKKGGIKKIN